MKNKLSEIETYTSSSYVSYSWDFEGTESIRLDDRRVEVGRRDKVSFSNLEYTDLETFKKSYDYYPLPGTKEYAEYNKLEKKPPRLFKEVADVGEFAVYLQRKNELKVFYKGIGFTLSVKNEKTGLYHNSIANEIIKELFNDL